jgi:hypothetical protein
MKQLNSSGLFLLILICFSCSNSSNTPSVSNDNPLMAKYAGGYIVEVKGVPNTEEGELFVLHQNSQAKWLWIEVKNGTSEIKSEKTGSWTATEDKITITIDGNSEPIIETYNLVEDKFINGDRSLIKNELL